MQTTTKKDSKINPFKVVGEPPALTQSYVDSSQYLTPHGRFLLNTQMLFF